MKLIMYGSEICPDCVEANGILADMTHIQFDYRNISEDISILKEFLAYRDHERIFHPVIEDGKVGIPLFILEDGTKTFDISDVIDGKGHC